MVKKAGGGKRELCGSVIDRMSKNRNENDVECSISREYVRVFVFYHKFNLPAYRAMASLVRVSGSLIRRQIDIYLGILCVHNIECPLSFANAQGSLFMTVKTSHETIRPKTLGSQFRADRILGFSSKCMCRLAVTYLTETVNLISILWVHLANAYFWPF